MTSQLAGAPVANGAAADARRFTYTQSQLLLAAGADATTSGAMTPDTTGEEGGTPPTVARASPPSPSARDSPPVNGRRSANDFKFIRIIGAGSFSDVVLAVENGTDRRVAIKMCDKQKIQRQKVTKHIMREKEVLVTLSPHPLICELYATFHDASRLYFVLQLAPNGELLHHLRRYGSFEEETVRFYAAEVALALDYMHSKGVIHRDMKPENILLSDKWHVLISDFGSAKLLTPAEKQALDAALPTTADAIATLSHPPPPPVARARVADAKARTPSTDDSDTENDDNTARVRKVRQSSFVGTAQYVSPEVLDGSAVTYSADYWALGCIIYQMLAGGPPFRGVASAFAAASDYAIFTRVRDVDYTLPAGFPDVPADLVKRLIVREPTDRLNTRNIRAHAFFANVKWDALVDMAAPGFHPYLPASGDGEPELRSAVPTLIDVGDGDAHAHVAPGLDDGRLAALHADDTSDELAMVGTRRPEHAARSAPRALAGVRITTDDAPSPSSPSTSSSSSAANSAAKRSKSTAVAPLLDAGALSGRPARSPTRAKTSVQHVSASALAELRAAAVEHESRRLYDECLALLVDKERRRARLGVQRRTHKMHKHVNDHVILKEGYFDKKVGLFSRTRLFLLTEGPHLYYVDEPNDTLKGEIPFCATMKTEAKNFKTFFVHTPGRTYYLSNKHVYTAGEWCDAIDAVRDHYFKSKGEQPESVDKSSDDDELL